MQLRPRKQQAASPSFKKKIPAFVVLVFRERQCVFDVKKEVCYYPEETQPLIVSNLEEFFEDDDFPDSYPDVLTVLTKHAHETFMFTIRTPVPSSATDIQNRLDSFNDSPYKDKLQPNQVVMYLLGGVEMLDMEYDRVCQPCNLLALLTTTTTVRTVVKSEETPPRVAADLQHAKPVFIRPRIVLFLLLLLLMLLCFVINKIGQDL